jgi:signal transduction histidine kinase
VSFRTGSACLLSTMKGDCQDNDEVAVDEREQLNSHGRKACSFAKDRWGEVAMITSDPLGAVERAAIAEEIAGAARHDLRNRLASIGGAAFYLRRRVATTPLWASDPRIERFFEVIDEEVATSTSLLADHMVLKHLFARRTTRIDAAACVRAAVACARLAPDAEVRVEVEAGAGEVHADETELALAIRCLIENAVEATSAGGVVRVHGGRDSAAFTAEISNAGSSLGHCPEETALRPFFTTKAGHAGLGLNIAQRIARRYRGNLTICSEPAGTRVKLVIPRADKAA